MTTALAVDRIVRILAAISAVAFLPIVLLVGVMANDSGTPAGERSSWIVLLLGASLSGWVLLCSIAPRLIAKFLKGRSVLCSLVIKVPVYAFAIAGVGILVLRAMPHGPSDAQRARNALAFQCERDEEARLHSFFSSQPPEICRRVKVRELMHKCAVENGSTLWQDIGPQGMPPECTETVMRGAPVR